MAQMDGVRGDFLMGENPAVGSANAKIQRLGMANLDWLVVRDFSLIESATWWKDGPEIESGEMRTEDIDTEVFFLPAATHTEKDGSFTNTQRMLQWHHQAVEPAGDARSDLWFMYHLGRIIRKKLAGSTDEMDRPLLDLTWDYPTHGRPDEPSAEAVLAEVNGFDADGNPLSSYTQLKDDGSTRCGCWIYCGCYADGVNQTDRRKPGKDQHWVAPEWGWAWPSNRRILYNRASADTDGNPWSDRKAYVWWDADEGKWTGHDVPDFIADRPPDYKPPRDATGPDALVYDDPFIMQADGKAWLFVPTGLTDGPFPTHYEPQESPFTNPLYEQQRNPVRHLLPPHPDNRYAPSGGSPGADVPVRDDDLPAHRAPHGGRYVALAAVPGRAAAGVLLRGVAGNGGQAGPGARRLGDDRQPARGRRGPRAGHRADAALGRGRQDRPPGRAALPLGPERLQHRRRRERAAAPVPGPEHPHPGGEGGHVRRPSRPPCARSGRPGAGPRVPGPGRASPTRPGRRSSGRRAGAPRRGRVRR